MASAEEYRSFLTDIERPWKTRTRPPRPGLLPLISQLWGSILGVGSIWAGRAQIIETLVYAVRARTRSEQPWNTHR